MSTQHKKKKISIGICAIIIIIGIIMIVVKGFNFDIYYGDSKSIYVSLKNTVNEEEISQIVKEVFKNKRVMVQTVEMYKDMVKITARDITEEERTNLQNKINEKYNLELELSENDMKVNSHVRGRDIIKPYIAPILIATIIVAVYMGIRIKKWIVILDYLTINVIVCLIYASIIAITRMPINIYTIPIGLLLYVVTTLLYSNKLEEEIKELKKKEESAKA